jgi:GNAT superfamily N-acetyltransferase
VSERLDLRDEPADGPAARALFAEYMALVGERLGLGAGFEPPERIFASPDAFAEPGAAWLVLYEADRAVACGGLRTLEPSVGEIKRMFVTASARGRGYGRLLLRELERRAAAHGHRSVRLLTTTVLREALELYASEGYSELAREERPGEATEIWLVKAL